MWEDVLLLQRSPTAICLYRTLPNNTFSYFSIGSDFHGPLYLFVFCISLLFCQFSYSVHPYFYLYPYLHLWLYPYLSSVSNVHICLSISWIYLFICLSTQVQEMYKVWYSWMYNVPMLPVLSQEMISHTWGITTSPGSISREQFGWACPTCLNWGFGGNWGNWGKNLDFFLHCVIALHLPSFLLSRFFNPLRYSVSSSDN